MKFYSRQFAAGRRARGFTLVEVVAAVLILAGILTSSMVVMNHCVGATIDLRNRERAFELARENLEFLLTGNTAKQGLEYGFDDINPEIQWQITVEPFYEPVSNRMWIRAVSSAEYVDTEGERQTVELQHWLTGLTAQQVKMIEAQQNMEEEFLNSLYGEAETQRQELTKSYLEQEALDVEAYEQFLDRQREKKIAYLKENGYDDGYDRFLDELRAAEDRFLDGLGVNWGDYQDYFRKYLGDEPGTTTNDGYGQPDGTEADIEDAPSDYTGGGLSGGQSPDFSESPSP